MTVAIVIHRTSSRAAARCVVLVGALLLVDGWAARAQEVVSVAPTIHVPAQATPIARCGGGDVWELSTRHLPAANACQPPDLERWQVHRFDGRCWQSASIDEALHGSATSPLPPQVILYVHGNWMERSNARERVRIIDSYVARRSVGPYRLIMLSWPSERDERLLTDVRHNAQRADTESHRLAALLDVWSLGGPQVSLLGFSFGARTVVGALHLHTVRRNVVGPYRVSFVAPAVDRDWLDPRGRYSQAFANVDQVVNLYNSRDPILRRFRFIDNLSRPIAAGFAGFEGVADPRATAPLAAGQSTRIRQFDCRSQIGVTHSERSYYGECPYFSTAIDNILWK